MVEKLKPAKFDVNSDLKTAFYKEQADKYGFSIVSKVENGQLK